MSEIRHLKVHGVGYDIASVHDLTDEERRVLGSVEEGAQANVIESIEVEGGTVVLTGKTVRVTGLQKALTAAAGSGISIGADGSIRCTLDTGVFKTVTALPDAPATGDEQKIHLVPDQSGSGQNVFKEYLFANGRWEELGTFQSVVDLSDYATKSFVTDGYVAKVSGKGLSANDYTDGDKAAVEAAAAADARQDSAISANSESISDIIASLAVLTNRTLWYGIEWDDAVSSSAVTRIGNLDLHHELPVESGMRGCLLDDDGRVTDYLPGAGQSWLEGCAIDGSGGQVMVEMREHYFKFEDEGTKHRRKESIFPLSGYTKFPKMYVGSEEATVQRSASKLCSVVNAGPDFRGGNNQADWDALPKSMLGMPATRLSRTKFRTYARNRKPGSAEWNAYPYPLYKGLYWLIVTEFADRHIQLPYNPEPTADGFRQGGLGPGVTTLDSSKWAAFNDYYPVVPCGATAALGGGTGVAAYTLPAEYDATPFTVYVPRYRGVQLHSGLFTWSDGINVLIGADAANGGDGLSRVMVCRSPDLYSDTGCEHYEHVGNEARTSGYIKEIIGGPGGEIITSAVGGDSSGRFADYHYTTIPSSGTALRGVLFGGYAYHGSMAGLAYASSCYAPSDSSARIASRLCFIPESA